MIRKFLSHRRRGALAMVAVAGLVPVTAMMSANLNTSQMVDDRRQAQDAADALATMHGTWSARALNIISMNNVTAAQLLSVAVGSEALFMTTTELTAGSLAATAVIKAHEAQHCTPRNQAEAILWSGPCIGWHEMVNFPAYLALARTADIVSDFDPAHGIRTARKALDAIDGMNKALAARHPRAMAEIAEENHRLLEINDHHFADPCDGPGVTNCQTTNSGDGMALPIEDASPLAYGRLALLMEIGANASDTTFLQRGFPRLKGPLSHGGSQRRPHLKDHINNITEIGNALYEFNRFYKSRISHMPRRPFTGPGSGIISGFLPPAEPVYRGDRFQDRNTTFWDTLVPALEFADPLNKMALGLMRNVPLMGFDRHNRHGYLVSSTQGRQRNNSFFNNFLIAHGSVGLAPKARSYVPIGFDIGRFEVVFPVTVPEIWQLEGIRPIDPLPPIEATAMPDAFRILAFGLKENSRRLAQSVMSSPVTTHTGYGQTGVFNPDGATLFTQNWHSKLMPATRMDAPRDAGRNLGRQARSGFDNLAEDLQQVQSFSSWSRVNAH